ncbi:MAG TPA: 3'(2'),5'-bisphosphate nucleotidase CysQ, partial [Planctomycetota bacterium]|nr:3'(2'),5'-bisphosphate nucleotidase CysQ [Planctomycetota bacterium]
MTAEGPREALEFARELALQAGALVMGWFEGEYAIDDKDGQPVTIADRQANALIVEALAARYPADAILAEETPVLDDRWAAAERCWVVDPLDGTSDFVKGREGFAVMIGLLVRGRPALGVVHVPRAGRTFLGAVGIGAWEERGAQAGAPAAERRPLRCSSRAATSELRVIASIAHRDARLESALAALAPQETLSVGSVGYKVGKIAADEADLYLAVTPSIHLWDTAGPEAVLLAAGGASFDLDGRPLDYSGPHLNHRRGLLATNGACAPAVLAKLQ